MQAAIPVPRRSLQEYVLGLSVADLDACREVALTLREAGCPVDVLAVQLLGAAQAHVGTAWAAGRWSVSAERRATRITGLVLDALLADQHPALPRRGRVVLTPALTEAHDLGLRIAAAVLAGRGWQVEVLGARSGVDAGTDDGGAPLAAALAALDLDDVVAVGVGAVTTSTLAGAWQSIRLLRGAGVRVLAGGRALERDQRGVRLGADASPPDLVAGDLVLGRWARSSPVPARDDVVPVEHVEIADRLTAQRALRVEAALDRVSSVAPALVDTPAARAVAADDLGLALDATVGALLLDDSRVLRDHVAWSGHVLASYGSSRMVSQLWFQALRDTLPTWAGDVRGIVETALPQSISLGEQVARTRLPPLVERLVPVP